MSSSIKSFGKINIEEGESMKEECCIPLGNESVCVKDECGHWSIEEKRCTYYDKETKP